MAEVQMVMLDLETMSTKHNAAIASIGAVKFNSETQEIGDTFYQTIDLKSCKDAGLHFSKDTIAWWKKQPIEVLNALKIDTLPLAEALQKFKTWYGPYSRPTWGCGSDFDNVILESAFDAVELTPPWKYYHNRCYRTLRETIGIREVKREGTYHNALDDAMHQTKQLLAIFNS